MADGSQQRGVGLLALLDFRGLIILGNAICVSRIGAIPILPFTGGVLQPRIAGCNSQIGLEPMCGYFRKRCSRLCS